MYRNPLNHPTVMFRKSEIIRVGSYKNLKYFEDFELWIRCIKNAQIIINYKKPLVAMKRKSYMEKRKGYLYAFYEILFFANFSK